MDRTGASPEQFGPGSCHSTVSGHEVRSASVVRAADAGCSRLVKSRIGDAWGAMSLREVCLSCEAGMRSILSPRARVRTVSDGVARAAPSPDSCRSLVVGSQCVKGERSDHGVTAKPVLMLRAPAEQ